MFDTSIQQERAGGQHSLTAFSEQRTRKEILHAEKFCKAMNSGLCAGAQTYQVLRKREKGADNTIIRVIVYMSTRAV